MHSTGVPKPARPSSITRPIVILSSFPASHTLSAHKDLRGAGFASTGKLRTSSSCTFVGAKGGCKDTGEDKTSLQQHLMQLRNHPLLARLFRDNVHVQRLSTPNTLKKRLPLHLKQASVNWISNKKRALLTSLFTSSESLTSLLDVDASQPVPTEAGKAAAPRIVIVNQSPLNAVGVRINQSAGSILGEKRKKKEVSTERGKKDKKSVRKSGSHQNSKLTPEKVPLKEACRYREWAGRARDQLMSDFCRLLRLSNGVAVSPSIDPFFSYAYFLGKGNNHSLVKSCFNSRSWCRLTTEEDIHAANVVWTQGKIKALYRDLACVDSSTYTPKACKPMSVRCSVKIYTKNAVDNKGKTVDVRSLGYDLITKSLSFVQVDPSLIITPQSLRTHNKLEHNYHLTNKKSLFASIKTYYELLNRDPFSLIPVTFHIKHGVTDPEFSQFLDYFSNHVEDKSRNIWIIKPGENTNRGTGITVCSTLESIRAEISANANCAETGQKRTFILQKYIENPLLIHKRKFDIRCFALMTAVNGIIQGYFYQEGYLRTSSKEFSLKDVGNRYIHLTNDAVQKYSEDYGRFEAGNKLSYTDFQRYLDTHMADLRANVQKDVVSQIKSAIKTTFLATFAKINSENRVFSFEIFGYDFLLDSKMKVWLIEVNTNPCLELSSPLLARIIPKMLENTFKIAIDPYFIESSPGNRRPGSSILSGVMTENRFELIFSSLVDGAALKSELGLKFYHLEVAERELEDEPCEKDEELASEPSEDGC